MNRRDPLKVLATAAGGFFLPVLRIRPRVLLAQEAITSPAKALEGLQGEPPASSEIRIESGGPVLHLNGRRALPVWGMSASLLGAAGSYRASGLDLLSVILGLESGWKGPGRYDWSGLDLYLAKLLAVHPDAYFLQRLQLNAPR